jgi:hypothetical protein
MNVASQNPFAKEIRMQKVYTNKDEPCFLQQVSGVRWRMPFKAKKHF